MLNGPKKENRSIWRVTGCAMLIVLLAMLLYAMTLFDKTPAQEEQDARFAQAYAMAEGFAERKLTSPSTAKFPSNSISSRSA